MAVILFLALLLRLVAVAVDIFQTLQDQTAVLAAAAEVSLLAAQETHLQLLHPKEAMEAQAERLAEALTQEAVAVQAQPEAHIAVRHLTVAVMAAMELPLLFPAAA